jgi:hypothetical protein
VKPETTQHLDKARQAFNIDVPVYKGGFDLGATLDLTHLAIVALGLGYCVWLLYTRAGLCPRWIIYKVAVSRGFRFARLGRESF